MSCITYSLLYGIKRTTQIKSQNKGRRNSQKMFLSHSEDSAYDSEKLYEIDNLLKAGTSSQESSKLYEVQNQSN